MKTKKTANSTLVLRSNVRIIEKVETERQNMPYLAKLNDRISLTANSICMSETSNT